MRNRYCNDLKKIKFEDVVENLMDTKNFTLKLQVSIFFQKVGWPLAFNKKSSVVRGLRFYIRMGQKEYFKN